MDFPVVQVTLLSVLFIGYLLWRWYRLRNTVQRSQDPVVRRKVTADANASWMRLIAGTHAPYDEDYNRRRELR
jgi:hypothetical protein